VNQSRKNLLKTEQVAQWLGFSTRTITNWATKNLDSGGAEGIPAYKLDDEWRFDEDEVKEWLETKRGLTVQPRQLKVAAQA
jgi:excisionase family DNA binding protein